MTKVSPHNWVGNGKYVEVLIGSLGQLLCTGFGTREAFIQKLQEARQNNEFFTFSAFYINPDTGQQALQYLTVPAQLVLMIGKEHLGDPPLPEEHPPQRREPAIVVPGPGAGGKPRGDA